MARLEEKLGPSSETLHIIHSEMERDYYDAETRLVDPLLARSATVEMPFRFTIGVRVALSRDVKRTLME